MPIERREHLRITLTGKIDVKPEGITEPLNCYAINISKGGAAFYSEKPFEINAELHLTIFFKSNNAEKCEDVAGRVRWIKPVGNVFAIGVQFKEMSEDTHPMIISYIELTDSGTI